MAGLIPQVPLSFSPAAPVSVPILTERCLSSNFSTPGWYYSQEILAVTSSIVTNYTAPVLPPGFFNSDPPLYEPATNLSFCNVTVTYTHPGANDRINVNIWLPLAVSADVYSDGTASLQHEATSPAWNGILLSHGGGGFSTCLPEITSHPALSQGYAISRTDGGHGPMRLPDLTQPSIESWGLLSPGNVNMYNFQDFASEALHDMAYISKDVIKSFYGIPPQFSYFQGCSTGGRQGLMLAQRYPTDYHGILSGAPAIYWPKLMVFHWFGQMMMHSLQEYPKACEFEAITKAAIEECDELDGVKDGIVSNEEACNFDPFPVTNPKLRAPVPCKIKYADEDEEVHEMVNISHAAAHIAYHLWGGAKGSIRRPNWHRPTYSTPLAGMASSMCFRKNGTCIAAPNPMAADWLRVFLYKNPNITMEELASRVTLDELERLFHLSDQLYYSAISTSDPDLSDFERAGGKLLLWHGTSDEAIMPGQTVQYYNSVLDSAKTPYTRVKNVDDFFRLFMVPGVQHCGGGEGAVPINVFQQLRDWVEKGVAPEELDGESFTRSDGEKIHRKLCRYPDVARYKGKGHDMRKASSFECAPSF